MALGNISFVQEPVGTSDQVPVITNWNPIVPYTAHQDDVSGLFYFKFILEIRLDNSTGTLLGKLKQRRNGNTTDISTDKATAIFDVRDIANSQLYDTNADQNVPRASIHTLGANLATHPFSINNSQVITLYVKVYQEYSNDAGSSPAVNSSENDADTRRYIAASLPLERSRGTSDFQSNKFSAFKLDDNQARVLSDVQQSRASFPSGNLYRNYVQETDYHTIGFLNGYKDGTTDEFNSKMRYVWIRYYDSNGSQIGSPQDLSNKNSAGGCKPAQTDGELSDDTERLLYVGVGPANLQAQSENTSARPSEFSGWAYYKVYGQDAATNVVSDSYYFIKQDASCKGFKVRRLAWRNSLGCFDYFNFKMKSTQKIDVTRNEYQTVLGNFNDSTYSYDNFERGKRVRSVSAVIKETINTDFICEEDAQLLEGLIMSTNVQIVENADTTYTVPVIITDKSIERKTVANDGVKIQYTFNIEYANPYNTNS